MILLPCVPTCPDEKESQSTTRAIAIIPGIIYFFIREPPFPLKRFQLYLLPIKKREIGYPDKHILAFWRASGFIGR